VKADRLLGDAPVIPAVDDCLIGAKALMEGLEDWFGDEVAEGMTEGEVLKLGSILINLLNGAGVDCVLGATTSTLGDDARSSCVDVVFGFFLTTTTTAATMTVKIRIIEVGNSS
jgi:hypothetical protein